MCISDQLQSHVSHVVRDGLHVTLTVLLCALKVAQRAGEIAKELGLISQGEQGDASQTNATNGNWINLNLFNRNGSDATNSTWYSSDGTQGSEDQSVEAALQKYQQLDPIDEEEAEAAAAAAPSVMSPPLHRSANHTRLNSEPGSANELEQTKHQSRAERAGVKPAV